MSSQQSHRLKARLQTGIAAIACAFSLLSAYCADKNGVGPNAVSLPKGPGAIEGLGESFQPSLNTGTAGYGIGLKVPPGTAGLAPGLRLQYEGGGGNGPVGFGWQLSLPEVQRRTDKGIPAYGENVGFARPDIFINEAREELVPQANGDWFCKNEGMFIRYRQVSNHWEATRPDGTVMEFGLSDAGRVQEETNRVFSWLLERERDRHGNTIVYTYTSFPGTNDLNQKYIEEIRYGPGAPPWNNFHFVRFVYESRTDWFEDCRPGFVLRTGRRLKGIIIGTQGPALTNHLSGDFNQDGQPDWLNRKYVLEYTAYAGTNSHWSLLAKVTMVGADGVSALPPAGLGYTLCDPPDIITLSNQVIGGLDEPPLVMDSPQVDFLDLNGDGLPDLLRTDPGGSSHWGYLNRGEATDGSGRAIRWGAGTELASEDGLALLFNLQSTAPISHLADMNGDGVSDLAVTALDGSVLYFANQGQLGWGPRRNMAIQDVSPPSPFGNPDVQTADLDFDKRMDIVQSVSTGTGADYRVWFNLGAQEYSSSTTVPQNSGWMFPTPGVQIVDFNGDRVPDIVWVRPEWVVVTAGLGYGRFADPIQVGFGDVTLDETQIGKASLNDVNGDGLADLVLERAAPGQLWYWLNLGNYRFSGRKIIVGMPAGVGGSAVIRWADVNGNGTTDLVYADSASVPRMQTVDIGMLVNCGSLPNLLVAISNGIGRVTFIRYDSSTTFALADAAAERPWPDLMPNPVTVVSAVTNLDSLGHQYVTQWRYHNGYYDPVEKQFRGFAETEQIDLGDLGAPMLVTRSRFDTGRDHEALKGKLLSLVFEEESGGIFSTETNYWTVPPRTLYTGTNGQQVAYAHPVGSVRVVSELGQGTPRRIETESAYDQFGNLTTNAHYGIVENGNRGAWNDERIITIDYAVNLEAWLLRMPRLQEVRTLQGQVLSRRENFYDDTSFSGTNSGVLVLGDRTMTRDWIAPSNSAAYIVSERCRYDAYGNRTAILDPLALAGNAGAGHFREIAFDARFQTYPVAETIHVGDGKAPLVFGAGYDEGFGTPQFSADFNTNVTLYAHDAFGRLERVVKPYDTMAYPTVEYAYSLAQPVGGTGIVNWIESRQLDREPGSAGSRLAHYHLARQYVDGLGRELMSKQEAEPATPGGPPRAVINGATRFNARQVEKDRLNPCFSAVSGADLEAVLAYENIEAEGWHGIFGGVNGLITLDLDAAHKLSTRYDALVRPLYVTNQDGTFQQTVYEPLLTRSLDENQTAPTPHAGAAMAYVRDGLDRLVRVDEVVKLNDDGTSSTTTNTWSTHYRYDANDQLVGITDSQNNSKEMAYDGLKRKTSMNDPDRGRMSYQYDAASNLLETEDARGQHIVYTYDGANRMLTETYVGSTLSPRLGEDRGEGPVNVAYHYDLPAGEVDQGDGTVAAAQHTRGMLSFVSDGSGEEHISYDARGRLHYTVKRISDPELVGPGVPPAGVLVAYRTEFEYDSLDRLLRLVYPDNDEVIYQYNERTLLSRIVGGTTGSVISNLVYWPSDQQRQMDYGNGIRASHSYDSRLRLQNLISAPGDNPATPLIAFRYTFDPVSNIRMIEDDRPGTIIPTGDKRRNTQQFDYDDLYRLIRAQYSFNVPGSPLRNDGELAYRYDRIGNLLSQASDIQHEEKGVSLTQLGELAYGGTQGPSGRLGRDPGDPPGPHALTAIVPPGTNTARYYSYDANGNMTLIDGLTCTWDYKDRLVAVENEEMRAEYTYDYTDRRITKRVIAKSSEPPGGGANESHR